MLSVIFIWKGRLTPQNWRVQQSVSENDSYEEVTATERFLNNELTKRSFAEMPPRPFLKYVKSLKQLCKKVDQSTQVSEKAITIQFVSLHSRRKETMIT